MTAMEASGDEGDEGSKAKTGDDTEFTYEYEYDEDPDGLDGGVPDEIPGEHRM